MDLAFQRTKLSNQRTYLSYICELDLHKFIIAGTFKKLWIVLFGLIMILVSTIQYILLNNKFKNKENIKKMDIPYLDYIPIIYVILSIGTLYLHCKN